MSRLTRPIAAIAACAAILAAMPGAAVTIPASLQAKLQGMSAEKLAFIRNEEGLARFGLTPEKLFLELERRSAADADAYVTALMSVIAESKFRPGTDSSEIPLNPNAPGFNAATTLRPPIFDERWREPGPFSLDRYMYQKGGVPTFAHAPIAIRKEDLVAGKVEVAFVGVPLDFSSGWRDAKHGPMFLRAMDGLTGSDPGSLVDPSVELRLADYGNLAVDYMSPERSMDHVRMMVRDMAEAGTIPFIVGGDRSVLYPGVAAMVDAYGKGNVGLIHLDAHYEGIEEEEHSIIDRQAIGRLVSDGLMSGPNLVQVGLRGPEPATPALTAMRKAGVRYHTMAEVERSGWDAVVAKAVKEARDGPENVFLSFDLSVLDPAYATGAGRPVPGGLTMREAMPLVRRLCAETKVVGFALLDPAPILDPTYKTSLNANYVMRACLAGIAMRKKGLAKADYVDALAISHGQR